MIGEYKPFDQTLFRQNDPTARQIVKAYLLKSDISVIDNPDPYGVDLISPDNLLKIEVERRVVWKTPEFPFDTINFLERKALRFQQSAFHYIIVSENYKNLGMIRASTLAKYLSSTNLQENPNKFVDRGELFYKLPKVEFRWVTL
jgi:hypothetical protein